MSNEDVLDVIVVGAGLAGLACAHELASAGLQVIVLERGDVAGAKNLSGGRLYLEPVRDLSGDLLKGAPFERPVVSESISLCDQRTSASFRVDHPQEPDRPNSVTVLRARLDRHLADRVTERGGMVLAQQRVDGLLRDQGRVAGVRAGPEELRARVVVAADGALSFLAEEAGLRAGRDAHAYSVGIKEVIQLDASVLEERFNLAPGQGAARLYLGAVTRGHPGGGFIYTNSDSLSLGLVLQANALRAWKSESFFWELLEEFKARQDVSPLIDGGRTVEYGAHLIPEGGFVQLPPPGLPGLLLAGDAAGFVLNTGAVMRGMDLALASGVLAGRSIVESRGSGFDAAVCLDGYRRALQRSFVMRQLRTHRKAAGVLSSERLYNRYPHRLVEWASRLFQVDASGEHLRARSALKSLRRDVLGWRGIRDLWRLTRM
jgi:electron transfer flavoprotein-quinone oxidoreductase